MGSGATRTITPRKLIGWFGAQRRGLWVSHRVREALVSLKLETHPDFEFAWLDAEISFRKAVPKAASKPPKDEKAPEGLVQRVSDPTYRIGKLDAANRPLVTVAPDAPITRAVTLMITHDYSQLPVMQGERTVKEMLSWTSLGQRLALGPPTISVSECAIPHHEISSDVSLFDAIEGIVRHGYALIRGPDNKVSGIVTTTDLGLQFGRLGEPFLLIGEIENYLRRIIQSRLTLDVIKAAKDPADTEREIASVEDLTFGEYVRLLEGASNWTSIALNLDRDEFVKGLHEIRRIRNDVMHFDPDGPSPEDIAILRRWVTLFQKLSSLRVI